jgi:hypothetical protein
VSDLVDFLRARLLEDEAVALTAKRAGFREEGISWVTLAIDVSPALTISPDRLLAEVDAKRRVLLMFEQYAREVPSSSDTSAYLTSPTTMLVPGLAACLAALALPYADHPDYDAAWTI